MGVDIKRRSTLRNCQGRIADWKSSGKAPAGMPEIPWKERISRKPGEGQAEDDGES